MQAEGRGSGVAGVAGEGARAAGEGQGSRGGTG